MNNNHSAFASDLSKGINCFYAHQILPNGRTEQIGYSLNFIHLTELELGSAPLDWLQDTEIPITDKGYEKARNLVEHFFNSAHPLFSIFSPVTKTYPTVGACYVNRSRIGHIIGTVRDSTKLTFVGYLESDKKVSAFASIYEPEEFLKEDYVQIEQSNLTELDKLIQETIEKLKISIYS